MSYPPPRYVDATGSVSAHLRPAEIDACVVDAPPGRVELAAQLLGLPPQVEEGNAQLASSQ